MHLVVIVLFSDPLQTSNVWYIMWMQVEAIGPKRMLAFLNHFVVHTSSFLNRFSVVCEEKLQDLSVRLQRLETAVCLLEAKVSRVRTMHKKLGPDLQNILRLSYDNTIITIDFLW